MKTTKKTPERSKFSINKFFSLFATVMVSTRTLLLTSCDQISNKVSQASGNIDPKSSDVLTVLAGSKLKDIEPFLGDIKKETGGDFTA